MIFSEEDFRKIEAVYLSVTQALGITFEVPDDNTQLDEANDVISLVEEAKVSITAAYTIAKRLCPEYEPKA